MILPLTTGGPDESALGDPVEATLTQWAEACRKQGGINILPHFPNPKAENAAAIVAELIDAVEVTKGWHGVGINPFYLSDWYRYLNCGYNLAAVGGTDKMGAYIAVGEMRTYAKLFPGDFLSYNAWKRAVAAGRTFTTCGTLAGLAIDAHEVGETIHIDGPATLSARWEAAGVVLPIMSAELIANGEVIEAHDFGEAGLYGEYSGCFTIPVKESAWYALRLRSRGPGQEEASITAHTSAIFVLVNGTPLFNGPDAATILDQIEGAATYLRLLGTKAQERRFKLALSALSGAHRALHNRMHAAGLYHHHMENQEKHAGH
jgi:hypothetical protein